jgi:hypothetical protein
MRIVTWYKSWFRASGTLDFKAYVKHIAAAYAFFFGFFFLGAGLWFPLHDTRIALHAPAWAGFLSILIGLSLLLLAVGSWIGIVVTSSTRFVRHLMQR